MPMRPPIHQAPHVASASPEKEGHGWKGNPTRLGLYDQRWRNLRRAFLAANPLCLFCLNEDRVEPATQVDHIQSVAERPELRLTWSNLRGLCATHHSRRTATEQRGSRMV